MSSGLIFLMQRGGGPYEALTLGAAPPAWYQLLRQLLSLLLQVLRETSLVEAFNLKAAIEYDMRNYDTAREALTDMPPRSEEELDAVSGTAS
jgi:hypothetical protein